MKLKAKPFHLDAVQYKGDNFTELEEFTGGAVKLDNDFLGVHPADGKSKLQLNQVPKQPYVFNTRQNEWFPVFDGDYVVRGPLGGFLPLEDEVVEELFEVNV